MAHRLLKRSPLWWIAVAAIAAIFMFQLYNNVKVEKNENAVQRLVRDFDTGYMLNRQADESVKLPVEPQGQCSSSFAMEGKAVSDINVLDIYNDLVFNNTRNRYANWQRSWQIKTNEYRFTEKEPLTVFLLPHSHNDPGWLKTFEEYYKNQTRNILDLVLEHLDKDPEMKFIWAEMSFFSLWWDGITPEKKLLVKKVVNRKQLEFVTGGWVMPDEANSHYYSILMQQFEGNQWLQQHLNYTPRNGWSIDPFGLSPTMAYILKRSGFSNMLIQRTHYLVKQYLGNKQELEFLWRQNWDNSGSTDIMTHMMPFSSYTTASTCGPDEQICRSFEYIEDSKPFTIEITTKNIGNRTARLVEQYKKKAMLFKTNNILVPLGTDFAWATETEWKNMTRNYNNISNHVNENKKLYTKMRYGTLDEYFEAIKTDAKSRNISPSKLSGDFFTYADKDDHYWSGYYTSRPFHKALDRKLITNLRAGHIAYTFLNAELLKKSGDLSKFPFMTKLYGYLRNARRSLSLFQHHDGVAGTSKDFVMKDYAEKLDHAISNCSYVMEKCLQILTQVNHESLITELQSISYLNDTKIFKLQQKSIFTKVPIHTLPTEEVIQLPSSNPQAIVTIFNSLAQRRTNLVSLKIQIENPGMTVQVSNLKGEVADSELFPVFENDVETSEDIFHLHFLANLDPLAINSFIITLTDRDPSAQRPEIIFIGRTSTNISLEHDKFDILQENTSYKINISNANFCLNFDSDGFVKTLEQNGETRNLTIRLFTYGTQKLGGIPSGLYLFRPDGPAKPLELNSFIKIIKGRLQCYVEVSLAVITHRITIYNHSGLESNSVEIRNVIDIRDKTNFELVMRLQSDIDSGNTSYTDLNGFQMIERKRFPSMPLQGHYYPMPTATYIEDANIRMTVLGGQPVGTASLKSGHIDVVMDRTLKDDDHLGVGQGSGKSIQNINNFKLLFETPFCQDGRKEEKAPMLSLTANLIRNQLLHPLQIFRTVATDPEYNLEEDLHIADYQPSKSIACDVEIVDTIPLANFTDSLDDHSYFPMQGAAVLIHRFGFDARFDSHSKFLKCEANSFGQLSLNSLFPNVLRNNVIQKSLSFLHELTMLKAKDTIFLDPMEVYNFHVQFADTS